MSEHLTKEFGKGFTVTNLKYMRQFYRAFPIRHTLCDELSWSHYRLLASQDKESVKNEIGLPEKIEPKKIVRDPYVL